MRSIVEITHHLIKPLFGHDDIMIDATMGNGFDTLFLARHAKFVYSFDIQEVAIKQTEKLLKSHDIHNVMLIHDSHENILHHTAKFKGVIFNLGYLPKGDKTVTTQWEITKKTLDKLLVALPEQGFIAIVVYPGHPNGKIESDGLRIYLKDIDQHVFYIMRLDLPFINNDPPYLFLIKKNASLQ